MSTPQPTRDVIVHLVQSSVQTILQRRGIRVELSEQTVLSGAPDAVLDSLGIVMLTVEIEQRITDYFNGQYRLSPEGLMAAATSDVETVESLASLVLATLESNHTP